MNPRSGGFPKPRILGQTGKLQRGVIAPTVPAKNGAVAKSASCTNKNCRAGRPRPPRNSGNIARQTPRKHAGPAERCDYHETSFVFAAFGGAGAPRPTFISSYFVQFHNFATAPFAAFTGDGRFSGIGLCNGKQPVKIRHGSNIGRRIGLRHMAISILKGRLHRRPA